VDWKLRVRDLTASEGPRAPGRDSGKHIEHRKNREGLEADQDQPEVQGREPRRGR